MTLRNPKAEASLVNLDPSDSRLPVLVEDFPSYVKSMHANTDHLFSEEYEVCKVCEMCEYDPPSSTDSVHQVPQLGPRPMFSTVQCCQEQICKYQLLR